mgnify:CR=1 FL=1
MENYTRMKKLGEGGFGLVFLAKDNRDGQLYVMKEVDLGKLDAKARADSVKEAEFLKKLKHPNIIGYHEYFQTTTQQRTRFGNVDVQKLYIMMHYADGGDLETRIKARRGQLFPENEVLDWFVQMTLALKHIHDRKILHRDIKSQNVFLMAKNSIVKLGDFGIAKSLAHTHAQARTMIGTPYYLSPEICREAPYDAKSDIWALGVVLYELMCLRHPFQGNSMKELLQRICTTQPAPPSNTYSRELRALLSRLLDKNPEQRPSVNAILHVPIVRARIARFLSANVLQEEFSHTVIHAAGSLKQHAALAILQQDANGNNNNSNPAGGSAVPGAAAAAAAFAGAGRAAPPPQQPQQPAAVAGPAAPSQHQQRAAAAAVAEAARAAEAARLAERQLQLLQQRRAQMQAQADARAKAEAESRARAVAALRAREEKAREEERKRQEREKERERERVARGKVEAQRRADAAKQAEAEAEQRRAVMRQNREEFLRNKERAAGNNNGGGDIDVVIYEGKKPAVRPIIPSSNNDNNADGGYGGYSGGSGGGGGGAYGSYGDNGGRRAAPAARSSEPERPPWRGVMDEDASYEEKLRAARLEYAREKEAARRRQMGLPPLDDDNYNGSSSGSGSNGSGSGSDGSSAPPLAPGGLDYTYSGADNAGIARVPSYARQPSGTGAGASSGSSGGGSSAPYGTDPYADRDRAAAAGSRASAQAKYEAEHARLRAEYDAERRAIAARHGANNGGGAGAAAAGGGGGGSALASAGASAVASSAPYYTDPAAQYRPYGSNNGSKGAAGSGSSDAPLSRKEEQRQYEAELQRLRNVYQQERASVERKLRGIVGDGTDPDAGAAAGASQSNNGSANNSAGSGYGAGYGAGYGSQPPSSSPSRPNSSGNGSGSGGYDAYSNPGARYGRYGSNGVANANSAAGGRVLTREEELEAARLAILEERRALQLKAAQYLADAGDDVVLPNQQRAAAAAATGNGSAPGTATAGAELSEARAAFMQHKAAAAAAAAANSNSNGNGSSAQSDKDAYLARLASRGVAAASVMRGGSGSNGSPATADSDFAGYDDAALPPSPYGAAAAAATPAAAATDSAGAGAAAEPGIGSTDDLTPEQALNALARDADEFLVMCNNMRAALDASEDDEAAVPVFNDDDEDDAVVRRMVGAGARSASAAATAAAGAGSGAGASRGGSRANAEAAPAFVPVPHRSRNASSVTAEVLQRAYYVNQQFRDSDTDKVVATVEADGFILDTKGNVVGFLTGGRSEGSGSAAASSASSASSGAAKVPGDEEDDDDVVAVHMLSSLPAAALGGAGGQQQRNGGSGGDGASNGGGVGSGTVRVYAPFAVGAKIESMDEEDIADILGE